MICICCELDLSEGETTKTSKGIMCWICYGHEIRHGKIK